MPASRTVVATVTALLMLTAASASIAAPRLGSAGKAGFRVTSSIDGKTTLPHRIRWIARHELPPAQIKQVDFLIDGKLAWIEHEPPYVYGDDDGPHRGYLVTSWLAPGIHRFAVRAIANDGRRGTSVVRARVTAPPDLPAGLAGTWQRSVSDTSGAPPAGSPGNPTDTILPEGTYTMVIDKRMLQVRFPGKFVRPASDDSGEGWILDSDYTVTAKGLRGAGPVTFEPFHLQAEAGWWCWPDGPSGDYGWSIRDDTLTLTPRGADPCAVRAFVWAGNWTRIA